MKLVRKGAQGFADRSPRNSRFALTALTARRLRSQSVCRSGWLSMKLYYHSTLLSFAFLMGANFETNDLAFQNKPRFRPLGLGSAVYLGMGDNNSPVAQLHQIIYDCEHATG